MLLGGMDQILINISIIHHTDASFQSKLMGSLFGASGDVLMATMSNRLQNPAHRINPGSVQRGVVSMFAWNKVV